MSLEVVNGYPCFNCTDVERAKRGVDPAHPEDDPREAKGPAKLGAGSDARDSAVIFGGALTAPSQTQVPDRESANLDGARLRRPGSMLDIRA